MSRPPVTARLPEGGQKSSWKSTIIRAGVKTEHDGCGIAGLVDDDMVEQAGGFVVLFVVAQCLGYGGLLFFSLGWSTTMILLRRRDCLIFRGRECMDERVRVNEVIDVKHVESERGGEASVHLAKTGCRLYHFIFTMLSFSTDTVEDYVNHTVM